MIGLAEGVGLGISVYNAISAASAARAAARRRAELLRKASVNNDRALGEMTTERGTNLMAMSGQLGDAVRTLGRASGDAMAQAGVTNSGVTGRSVLEAQDRGNSALLSADRQWAQDILNARNQYQQWLLGQELGAVQNDMAAAQATQAGGWQGVGSILGELSRQAAEKDAEKRRAAEQQASADRANQVNAPAASMPTLSGGAAGFFRPTLFRDRKTMELTSGELNPDASSWLQGGWGDGLHSELGRRTQAAFGRNPWAPVRARNVAPLRNGSQGWAPMNPWGGH